MAAALAVAVFAVLLIKRFLQVPLFMQRLLRLPRGPLSFLAARAFATKNTRGYQFLIENLELSANSRVLELGCGTGIGLKMASESIGNTGIVVGVDLSEEMVRLAKRGADGDKRVQVLKGDVAMPLHFEDNSFSHVVTQYSFIIPFIKT